MLEEHVKGNLPLFDTLGYPIYVVDPEFNVVFSNAAMKNLFENIGDAQDLKCYHLLHRSERPVKDCPMVRTLENKTPVLTELYVPFVKKHLLVNVSPVMSDGIIIGAIHSITDITEIKKKEEDYDQIIDIYASSINELKTREVRAQKGRDAFLNMLEDINESYKELENLFLKLILVMVNTLDAKSPWTRGHSERVSMYAEQIAEELLIDKDEVKSIKLAGLLHDIGKIGTYDYLLDKPGALTREEFEIVKKHPVQGADILQEIKQLRDIIPFVKYHHEKLDGNGYPESLKGSQIPLGARILHVADSFDSMTSDRPYRPAPGFEYALSELRRFQGTQFDHEVVEAFLKVLEKRNSRK
ncbi:MAG: HD domain-containing protein [Nitrospirae bacterium]|nr:HD domain-containing protein [Nitrospirota bacterium]